MKASYSWIWLLLLPLLFGINAPVAAQCINTTGFGSASVSPLDGVTVTATTCAFVNEYSIFSDLIAGNAYEFQHESGTGGWRLHPHARRQRLGPG